MTGSRLSGYRPRLAVLVAALCLAGGCQRGEQEPRTADPATRRTLRAGAVIGSKGAYGSDTWLGIPYAQPPVGPLRWRAPRPLAPWTGTREALTFGAPCVQYASPFGGVATASPGEAVGQEDCLFLNVWAPRYEPGTVPTGAARLPVMVWIHGGGNTIGDGGFYNGGHLATAERVIVVTLNYRLGPFGWFFHRALRGAGATPADAAGNYGTLDLIRALQWVHDNIAGFGGDPDNVTIFGESAGGTNVFSLLLAPPAAGLFQRAIVQSGGVYFSDPVRAEHFMDDPQPGDPNSSNEALARMLVADGTAADRAAAKARIATMSDGEIASFLRGRSAAAVLATYTPTPRVGMIAMPLVVREGTVVPVEEPLHRFGERSGYARVPVMLGTNRDENKLFMFGDPRWVRYLLWLFPRARDERHYNLAAEYLAKMWKAGGADEPARAMRGVQGPTVFVYRFDWDEEPTVMGADLSMLLGAAHGFEIPFVFGHFELGRASAAIFTSDNAPGREALSRQMMAYWAQFARAGAPGRGGADDLPEWTAWDNAPARPKCLVLDTPAGGGLRMIGDEQTRAEVIAAVDNDPRLPTQRDKCMIYHDLATWSRAFTKQDYPTAGTTGCADFPYDAYPWDPGT